MTIILSLYIFGIIFSFIFWMNLIQLKFKKQFREITDGEYILIFLAAVFYPIMWTIVVVNVMEKNKKKLNKFIREKVWKINE